MKKKYFLFAGLLAIVLTSLAISGVYAHTVAYDPQTGSGQVVVQGYNNSSTTFSAGEVVVWDTASSTGDNDMWIATTTTADTNIVAGVVWPADIAGNSTGSIVIWGYAKCQVGATGTAGAPGTLCTSTVAGDGAPCTDNDASYAITMAAAKNTTVECIVQP